METPYCPECGGHTTGVQALGCSMASVGRGVEASFDRQQVEWVFGLTGGELADKPLVFKDEDGEDRSWLYHYDSYPEWASTDFDGDEHEYFTLVEAGCSYGSCAPEWITFTDGSRAKRVAQYAQSGETECPGRNDEDQIVGKGYTEGMQRCPLCEEDAGEEHGYIYVGDSCESVYRTVDFDCAVCEVKKSDLTDAAPACDCVLASCTACGWRDIAPSNCVFTDKVYCPNCDEIATEILE